MLQHYRYPFRVWLTSVLVGPLLLLFESETTVLSYIFSVNFIPYYFAAILVGGFFSAPCFLFLWLYYTLLIRDNIYVWLIRVVLSLVSLLCCITVFIVMSLPDLNNFWSNGNITLIGAYTIPLIAGVLMYKVTTVKPKSNEIEVQ